MLLLKGFEPDEELLNGFELDDELENGFVVFEKLVTVFPELKTLAFEVVLLENGFLFPDLLKGFEVELLLNGLLLEEPPPPLLANGFLLEGVVVVPLLKGLLFEANGLLALLLNGDLLVLLFPSFSLLFDLSNGLFILT